MGRAVLIKFSIENNVRLSVLFQKFLGRYRYLVNKLNKMNLNPGNICTWQPARIIDTKRLLDENYSLFVLNRRIDVPREVVEHLWQNATIRITVDGGTNRWMSFIQKNCITNDMKPPDLITGDFDSVTKEALDFFDSPNTMKIHTPNQDQTDFTKALRVLKSHAEGKDIKKVIVLHEVSGRLDQLMANIQTLCLAPSILEVQVYLLSSNSLTWILKSGKHSINIPQEFVELQNYCALIPIKGSTTVTTTGLKWNLDGRDLAFGDLVSTSNTYASDIVTISTNKDLLWSMTIFEDDDE